MASASGAERVLSGAPAAPGRARGPLFVVAEESGAERAGVGIGEVREAAERVAGELEELAARRRPESPSAADVLEAQAMILRDPALEEAVGALLAEGVAPGAAATRAAARYAAQLEALDDLYLRERAADVHEAGRLLAAALTGGTALRLGGLRSPAVVVARELSPADLLGVEPDLTLALVTEAGGLTSHTAIVARELGIPAVVGVRGLLEAASGARVAEVNGDRGEVRLLARGSVRAQVRRLRRLAIERAPLRLMANVGSSRAALRAARLGAAGIGLYRTELLFLGAGAPPSAERQAEEYAAACAAMAPHPVTVRTLDAGADKALPYLAAVGESNPALGRRGIRLWLAHPELHRPQVEALVRVAAEHPNLRVMLPMVGDPYEVKEARRLFAAEARQRRVPPPVIGMMVELPAVAVALDMFAGLVEFVSIGTNDLAQYALAADRELAWPPGLGEFNPGALRLIRLCLEGATRLGLEAGVCGEMAGSVEGAVFLAGAGAGSLSMTAESLPAVLRALLRLGLDGCQEAAQAALAASDAVTARGRLRSALRRPRNPT